MNGVRKLSILERGTVAFLVAWCAQPAMAGIQGSFMNSLGYGKAVANVTFNGVAASSSSLAESGPCAAVHPQAFSCTTPPAGLPPGTPASVYCQCKGFPNYNWSIKAFVTGGATADNTNLDAKVTITPSACMASFTLDSSAEFKDATSGVILVSANVTAGAAVWLRGFEYPPSLPLPTNIVDLTTYGIVKWDTVLVGPFDSTPTDGGCSKLSIPFSLEFDKTNLYFVVDTEAKTIPFVIACSDVTFCGSDALAYPFPQVVSGGCGDPSTWTVTYDTPADLLPLGSTIVTGTVTDQAGNKAQCTFTATRQALSFAKFGLPIDGIGGTTVMPVRTFSQGTQIPVTFKVECQDSVVSNGTPTLMIQQDISPRLTGLFRTVDSGNFTFQSATGEWLFNWNTSNRFPGIYRLIATLQDGTQESVIARLLGE